MESCFLKIYVALVFHLIVASPPDRIKVGRPIVPRNETQSVAGNEDFASVQVWDPRLQDNSIIIDVSAALCRGENLAQQLCYHIHLRGRCKKKMRQFDGVNAKVALSKLDVARDAFHVTFERDEVIPVQFS